MPWLVRPSAMARAVSASRTAVKGNGNCTQMREAILTICGDTWATFERAHVANMRGRMAVDPRTSAIYTNSRKPLVFVDPEFVNNQVLAMFQSAESQCLAGGCTTHLGWQRAVMLCLSRPGSQTTDLLCLAAPSRYSKGLHNMWTVSMCQTGR